MTKYVAVFEKKVPDNLTGVHWKPWIMPEPDPQLPSMVCHAHIRNRGGVTAEEMPLTVVVCVRDTLELPCIVRTTTFSVGEKT